MDDRVGTLALRVQTDLEGREGEIRDLAERFTRAVIARVAMLLEERLPGRIVLLQQLPVRWTLSEHASTSVDELRAEVERAADATLARLALRDAEATPDAPAAVFATEAMWIAAALEARTRGTTAWFHQAALRDEPLERMIVQRSLATDVLGALAARDALLAVLVSAPRPLVTRLAAAVLDDTTMPVASDDDAPIVLVLVERIVAWPWLEPDVRRLAVHAYAIHAAPAATSPARIAQWTRRALAIAAPLRVAAPPIVATSPSAEVPTGDVRRAPAGSITDYAGLFYLVPAILELGLAEALWQACLPEGAVIADALRALVGADDPALATLAGEPTEVPASEAAQAMEIAVAAIAALVVALPRGGRAELPAAHVQLVEHAHGRLIVVTAQDAPFVWFAVPVPRAADVLAAIAALFARWPKHIPLHGAPSLVELDRTGRLRHATLAPPPPVLADGADVAGVAIGSVIVGAASQLVAARLGDRVDDVPAWVDARLARPGRIVVDADAVIEVWQPADAVDLEVRAAGIDRDPGFVPWLGRTVRLRFED